MLKLLRGVSVKSIILENVIAVRSHLGDRPQSVSEVRKDRRLSELAG